MKNLKIVLPILLFLLPVVGFCDLTQDSLQKKTLVYVFDIKKEIAEPVWRITKKSFAEADSLNADYILIHMNTYGGLLNSADSIRTKILNSRIPTMVFIDNNAASAGALISIACDSIYMRAGASIGAATVVNQSGQQVPDKYQSFMRATMRATAEAHGRDTIIKDGDTTLVWHRDPRIAEAMVDPRVYIPGISDTGKVLTLTTGEAIKVGYCEGEAESIAGVLDKAGIKDYEIKEFILSPLDKIIGFLVSPVVSGLLLMVIIGGIYFELRTPGVGFPLAASVLAAILYFAPLYLEGLAQHWEIILFIVGLILITVEIFAIPGFGVAGISGIILAVTGLSLSMVDNVVFSFDPSLAFLMLLKAIFIVLIAGLMGLIFAFILTKELFTSRKLRFALNTTQQKDAGFIGVSADIFQNLVGKHGVAKTVLRPAGKIEINGETYDARAEVGFIDRGEKIMVVRHLTGQLYVIKDV
ncbi:MAG: nodulation protein NfeD [Chlorobi bacterium]|nr:nodulation protein NfeD [Chlorobiota bacterium]